MEFIKSFKPTSKMQLKQVCQWYCNGDIKKAQEMYEYYAKDIELPDFDPVPETWQQSVKNNANGLMGWLRENKDTLSQGYQLLYQIIANKGKLPTSLGDAEEIIEDESIPSIN